MWYRWKKRQIGQWNRIKSPEKGPNKYSQLIFEREQRHYNEEKIAFSTNDAGTNGYLHYKKKESRHRPFAFHNNLK